ncbi:PilN domain-containing protein [Gallaecimonas sp. GXIMD4217]|uniref:PilN domain-containing protein n=1 Tax=Gallaecimonas sp. GXIMD4217 TaxID=3131927 RepID=UPI00311AE190
MKHDINLMTADLLPPPQRLSARTVLGSWLLAALLLVAGLGWAQWQQQQLEQRKAALAAREADINDQIARINRELDKQRIPPALADQKTRLEADVARGRLLLGELDKLQLGDGTRFSPVLEALARAHRPGVWLTGLHLEGRQLALRGAAYQPDAIPAWVQGFESQPVLAPRRFGALTLERQGDQVHFRLDAGGGNAEIH